MPAFFAYTKSLRICAGVVLHRDRAAAHDRDAGRFDLRAQRARGLWRIGAWQVDVLERHVLDAQRLGHVERLVQRELAHRIGRHAELQCHRLPGGGSVNLRPAPAMRLRTPAESAAPTNARRVRRFGHFSPPSGNAHCYYGICEPIRCGGSRCLWLLPAVRPSRCARKAPAISSCRYPATRNSTSRVVRSSPRPDRA